MVQQVLPRIRPLLLAALAGVLFTLSACASPTPALPLATATAKPDLAATAQSLSTEIANKAGIVGTSQALATIAALRPTLTPSITPTHSVPTPTGTILAPPTINLPEDIPLPVGGLKDLFTSPSLITFLIQTDFNQLVAFYDAKMNMMGWQKVENGSFITNGTAMLNYRKSDRAVNISLRFNSINNMTSVVITIQ